MPLVDDEQVVEALAANRPDHPLGDGVRVRRTNWRQDATYAQSAGARDPLLTVASIAIPNQVVRLAPPGRRLDQLSPEPGRRCDAG